MMDYKCDMDCPNNKPVCCEQCKTAREYYINDENKHLWTNEHGFWSDKGCKLPREQMPPECRAYDCRKYLWTRRIIYYWSGEWKVLEDDLYQGKCDCKKALNC